MKLAEAIEIISRGAVPLGYRVSFEWKKGSVLRGDFFPDRDEHLIPTEDAAWVLARQFAAATKGRCVNVHVTDDRFIPVAGYPALIIENREPTS